MLLPRLSQALRRESRVAVTGDPEKKSPWGVASKGHGGAGQGLVHAAMIVEPCHIRAGQGQGAEAEEDRAGG